MSSTTPHAEIKSVFDQAYNAIASRVTQVEKLGQSRLPGEMDLANELGISRDTVRRVISRLAKERVVASQKGRGTYILPRQIAGFTVLYDTHMAFFHPYVSAIMRGASAESQTLNCRMKWQSIPEWGDEHLAERLIDEVQNLRTQGYVVATPLHLQDCLKLVEAHVPLVILDVNFGTDRIPSVLVEHDKAGMMIGEYLAKRGYQRTALISGPIDDETIRKAQAVLTGMKQVLGGRAPVTGDTHIVTDRSLEEGREAMQRLLQLPEPPEAIVTTDDDTAVAAVSLLRELGLDGGSGPELVSYISSRDNLAELIPWTLVQSPSVELLGREVVCMLHQLMSGQELEQRVKWFAPSLTLRGKPKKRGRKRTG